MSRSIIGKMNRKLSNKWVKSREEGFGVKYLTSQAKNSSQTLRQKLKRIIEKVLISWDEQRQSTGELSHFALSQASVSLCVGTDFTLTLNRVNQIW